MPLLHARYYHVFIEPGEGVSIEQVEQKMNMAQDWFRYSAETWIAYSTATTETWKARLQPLVAKGGNFFVCELVIANKTGWMPKSFWEWIKSHPPRKSLGTRPG